MESTTGPPGKSIFYIFFCHLSGFTFHRFHLFTFQKQAKLTPGIDTGAALSFGGHEWRSYPLGVVGSVLGLGANDKGWGVAGCSLCENFLLIMCALSCLYVTL